jgi:hypothetical protein
MEYPISKCLTKIASPSKLAKKTCMGSNIISIKCGSNWSLALEICLVQIELKLHILPFFYGSDASNDHFAEVHFLGNNIRF